ncbi:hypothetical protein HNP46_002209 [Pseudomonas nitritireducens]|uniref:Uncharacterized protein n=1 Tax=Pseudomonas nitroreducens TaxID=46680 RepID=A0A7W7P1J8_PSENT|nr:hypothetical protein [Pseudomonas nitritireducens]MBB4863362.1 hypothetical protein [Pseudomonas nitritireducens]
MFVQFESEEEREVVSIFSCRQDDEAYPNQGEVAEHDPRVEAFIKLSGELAGIPKP